VNQLKFRALTCQVLTAPPNGSARKTQVLKMLRRIFCNLSAYSYLFQRAAFYLQKSLTQRFLKPVFHVQNH